MMATQNLFKFSCDGKDFFLLSTSSERQGSGITLVLCDTVCAWEGRVTPKDMTLWSEKTKMSQVDYEALTLNALMGNVSAKMQFEYEVNTLPAGVELMWKKLVGDGDIKFQLGSVSLKLSSTPNKVIGIIFEYAIKALGSFQQKMAVVGAERDRLIEDREMTLKRLTECATLKEDTERELFSKFAAVLNAKKEKLRELKSQCTVGSNRDSAVESNRDTAVATTSGHSKETKAANNSHSIQHLISDEDTDNENNYMTNVSSRNPKELKGKGKTTAASHDNLVLDDGSSDDEEEFLSIKRSRKNGRKVVKQPSKPIIPCVSTTKEDQHMTNTSQLSTRGSVRKSTSKSSSKSNNMDADNLLDDLA